MGQTFDCIIIGGGVTGAGISRDLSLRGIKTILLEKDDLAEGTTGRCHAMVHSGARYAYKDKIAAEECATESKILFKIAPHISESCGGYFLGISDEEVEFGDLFKEACERSNVWVEEIDPAVFLKLEPNCNPQTRRVFKVNDGYVDPFLLTAYNAYDAKLNGGIIKTYSEVRNLLFDGTQVVGVEYFDKINKSLEKIYGKLVINATGPWAGSFEKDMNLREPLHITPTMGTLLVFQNRVVNSVINRLRPSGDGDIFVPSHNSVILGTSSKAVELEDLENLQSTPGEIEYIVKLGEHLIPSIRNQRMIRYYSGARPLITNTGPLRDASRKFKILDYEELGYPGYITILGGKMTTYRLMAEKISDYVCKQFGVTEKCRTATTPLPGGDRDVDFREFQQGLHIDPKTAFDWSYKWGTFYEEFDDLCKNCLQTAMEPHGPKTICECEHVTEPEIRWVKNNFDVVKLDDYRRRTRQGMGPCQGQFCYFKMANLEAQLTNKSHSQIIAELNEALQKRWKTEKAGDKMIKRQIKLAKYMYRMGGYVQ